MIHARMPSMHEAHSIHSAVADVPTRSMSVIVRDEPPLFGRRADLDGWRATNRQQSDGEK
jgi:hypothetical protein